MTHLNYRATLWLVCNIHVRARALGCSFLRESRASHRWHAKGTWGTPVFSQLPSRLTHGDFFLVVPPLPKKTGIKNPQFSSMIYLPAMAALLTTQLININPFHASALSNQNTNSRFSICKKNYQKASVHTGPPCSSWLKSSRTVILHCDPIKFQPTLSKNL
jgi:hypothetical protein